MESHHKIQTDDLIILEAGSNDLLAAIEESKTEKSLAIINTAINSEETVIRKLLADGARHIVVTDEPNLGLVPRYYETNKQENATLWSQNYNEKWNKMLNKIKVDYPNAIRKYEFSKAFSKYQDLFKKKGKNTTQSAIKSIFRTLLTSGKITTEYINGAKPETLNDFFFLDEVHPTSLVQKMVGVDMIQLVKNWN